MNPTENSKECLFVIISKRDTVPLSPLIVIVSMYLKKFVSKKSESDSKTLRGGRRDVKMERSILTPL